MVYNPANDFVSISRLVAGAIHRAELPGLDFVIAALNRAGILNISLSATAPVANQSTTAWLQLASPSYSAEGSFQLWNGAAYVPATMRLLLEMLAQAEKVAASTIAISALLDTLSTTQGAIVARGASSWQAIAAGTNGFILTSNGPGTLPTWQAPGSTGVSSFNTRTGAVVLLAADVTGVGGALLASPNFTGTPTAPTNATATDSTTQLATDAFVQNAIAAKALRYDASQGLTAPQEAQARANAGAAAVVPPNGRLTLQTGTPVMTTNQTAKNTIFWTPYLGNQVPVYDGTNWSSVRSAEISVLTTDTTKNPAAIGVNKVNDWFLWSDAGTLRLSHGPDWTSSTVRSAGTALVLVDGIWMNNVAITNACGAQRGVYVGTTKSNGTSTLDWQFGAAGAPATPSLFNVWNMYNRVNVSAFSQDTTATWTYTSATPRGWNGSGAVAHAFVSGLAEDSIVTYSHLRVSFGNAAASFTNGFNLDTGTAFTAPQFSLGVGAIAGNQQVLVAANELQPQLGFHTVFAMEAGDGTNACTLVGGNSTFQFASRM